MKVHHVAITVNNLAESIKFYTQILSFKVVKEFAREDMGAKAAFLKLGDFHLELWQFSDLKENSDAPDDIKIRGIRHIAFEVDNLYEAIAELKKKGIKCSAPKLGASGHYYSFTKDPNGVALEFYEK